MTHIITAIKQDGLETKILNITLETNDENIDIINACKEATREYIATEEGLNIYTHNCECFNWADFEMYVPNEICEHHGFSKLHTETYNTQVDWNEQLIDEPTFYITNIQWDTDEEEIDSLPESYTIPFSELINENETIENISIEELKDRITDYLSDQFGFCILALVIE